jgi:outer membrane protein OmpA-like peptidoglycan-associated protein
MSIKVMGHTDSIGLPYHNLQLSQMRAIAVMNHLNAYLTKHARHLHLDVAYYGVGPSQPQLADDRCPGRGAERNRVDCLEPNRRVEVTARWSGEEVAATP